MDNNIVSTATATLSANSDHESSGNLITASLEDRNPILEARAWIESLGGLPVPVAPPSDELNEKGEPRFTGKNPSYLSKSGKRYMLGKFSEYINGDPNTKYNPKRIERMLSHDGMRIGLGPGCEKDGYTLVCLDIDDKRDKGNPRSPAEIDEIILAANPKLANTYKESTGSGAYHYLFWLRTEAYEGYTNYALACDPEHRCGELIGKGRYAVIAPSEGYELLSESRELVRLDELKGIVKDGSGKTGEQSAKVSNDVLPPANKSLEGKRLDLRSFITKSVADALKVDDFDEIKAIEDKSSLAAKVGKELFGWENYVLNAGGKVTERADSIYYNYCDKLLLDDERSDRIIPIAERQGLVPSLYKRFGNVRVKERIADTINKSEKKAERASKRAEKEAKRAEKEAKKADLAEAKEAALVEEKATGSIILDPCSPKTAGQICLQYAIDPEDWCVVGDNLYHYEGTYYREVEKADFITLVSPVLSSCVLIIANSDSVVRRNPFATSKANEEAYAYTKSMVRRFSPSEINPSGYINCTNGIIRTEISKGHFSFELIEHTPRYLFTNEPLIAYDPNADGENLEKLLSSIESEQQAAFLQILSCAIDLRGVRKVRGRNRATFLVGDGNNGKDTWRLCAELIFGKKGISGCTVSDFKAYDEGRKFGLYDLGGSRINWASENQVLGSIDRIESLKQAITGDPLYMEKKNVQAVSFEPNALCLFNTNDPPNISGLKSAIASRYVVVNLTKIYLENPTKKNEIKADPRFKEDKEWVIKEVCPALLNSLLKSLESVVLQGIDYSVFDGNIEDNKIRGNHLYDWLVNESNYVLDPNGEVSSRNIWDDLVSHYKTIGAIKDDRYTKDLRKGDPWVQSPAWLGRTLKRLIKDFDAVKRHSGKFYRGIRLATAEEMAEKKARLEKRDDDDDVVDANGNELTNVEYLSQKIEAVETPQDWAKVCADYQMIDVDDHTQAVAMGLQTNPDRPYDGYRNPAFEKAWNTVSQATRDRINQILGISNETERNSNQSGNLPSERNANYQNGTGPNHT